MSMSINLEVFLFYISVYVSISISFTIFLMFLSPDYSLLLFSSDFLSAGFLIK